jgi:hypothetical protein
MAAEARWSRISDAPHPKGRNANGGPQAQLGVAARRGGTTLGEAHPELPLATNHHTVSAPTIGMRRARLQPTAADQSLPRRHEKNCFHILLDDCG